MNRPRILVLDDRSIVLAGVRSLLAKDYELAGQASDLESLVEAALKLRPDLVIMGMPPLGGIYAVKQVRKAWPQARLLILTAASDRNLCQTMRVGVIGCIATTAAAEELLAAMKSVLRGETYVSPSLAPDIRETVQTTSGWDSTAAVTLTARQRQVLQLIAEGCGDKEIAAALNISVKTAQFHRSQLMQKLGIHSAVKLVAFAIREGLVTV